MFLSLNGCLARLLLISKGGYICLATDQLSTKITTLRDSIGASEVLWGNNDLRIKVRYSRSAAGDAFFSVNCPLTPILQSSYAMAH